ncbi:MAG: FAD-dependent oxidoreductase [Oscillospiraceae bacterium]|jgi:glycine/D-amino acid oxidase-like deaminating enzyme|nr:FAD-dependent oxidoreductase [Oscillospiraceae bacterium]
MNSLWEESTLIKRYNCLEGNINTDVLIIGGGMAGILCAYMLKRAGIECVLVEANRLCGGITKNTTAKVTSQHGLIYDKLIRRFDVQTAQLYLRANEEALQQYRRLCKNIDCHFEEMDNYVYSLNDDGKIEREFLALNSLGAPSRKADDLPLPFPVAGALIIPHQAQFNTLQFISVIARELRIFEQTTVRELIGTTAITDQGRINANRIIVATHFPFLNKHGAYFLKMFQHRSYLIALSGARLPKGMYVDESDSGLSFRTYGDLLLLGGGGSQTGKKCGGWQELREFAARHYPNAAEKYHWAAQDCMTLDGVPYIGRYSRGTENLYVAAGFNKWGMTSSMAAACLLSDMIQGKNNPYGELFEPSRSILHPQLAVNGLNAVVNLLTPASRRCPHMGCALKWNSEENSWDCPCHGSRFTKNGKLIDNPATGDLKTR